MRRFTLLILLSLTAVAAAADKDSKAGRKAAKDEDIGGSKKKTEIVPDKSLAGDVTRKKKTEEVVPALQYDQFRLGVESQVSEKRQQQIQDLEKLLSLTPNDKIETPKLLFRVGELYWEESKAYFFQANRKDDDFIRAQAAKDKPAMDRAKQEKADLIEQSKAQAKIAVEKYSQIVQQWKEFARTDEVLYFLGQNLMESGDEKRGLIAYKRLIEKYPKSKYLPDAYLAFGEYYFNNSKGKHEQLEKALDNYKHASEYPQSTAYGYALYKQGWCYFNMSDYEKAMDQFRAVVLYGKLVGPGEIEQGKGNKKGLVKEARNDYVRAYERLASSSPSDGRDRFSKLVDSPDELRDLMKKLANLYYDDGKDKEAALGFNMLIRERPTAPESPGFQGKIIDCVMRAGNKQQTINQVHQLVKITGEVNKANPKCKDDSKCWSQIKEAEELSERTLSNLAVNWHNEGKKTRDDATFKFANEVYADYLTLYPDSPKSYDLRFFWAELLNDQLNDYLKSSEQYTLTFQTDIKRIDKCTNGAQQADAQPAEENKDSESGPPPEEKKDEKVEKKKGGKGLCKWMKNAAYNAILANQEVVKSWEADAKNKTPAITDPTKSAEIPPVKKALIEACERYLKYIPNPEKKVEIAYKVAKIYYDYNHLDEAVPRLSDIALKYPDYKFENGDKVGVISANLVLDSYNLLGDWSKVNEWARKFFNVEKLFTGKDRDELRQADRAVGLQAGEPVRGAQGLREGRRRLHRLRHRVPPLGAGRPGALQREHRLLQRAHARQGDRAAQGADREVPQVEVRAPDALRARRRLRRHRRVRRRGELLRVVLRALREGQRLREEGPQARRRAASEEEEGQGREGRRGRRGAEGRADLGRGQGPDRALQLGHLPRRAGRLRQGAEEPREVPRLLG